MPLGVHRVLAETAADRVDQPLGCLFVPQQLRDFDDVDGRIVWQRIGRPSAGSKAIVDRPSRRGTSRLGVKEASRNLDIVTRRILGEVLEHIFGLRETALAEERIQGKLHRHEMIPASNLLGRTPLLRHRDRHSPSRSR